MAVVPNADFSLPYDRVNWHNKSDNVQTPLGKTNLNNMDAFIREVDLRTRMLYALWDPTGVNIEAINVVAANMQNIVTLLDNMDAIQDIVASGVLSPETVVQLKVLSENIEMLRALYNNMEPVQYLFDAMNSISLLLEHMKELLYVNDNMDYVIKLADMDLEKIYDAFLGDYS